MDGTEVTILQMAMTLVIVPSDVSAMQRVGYLNLWLRQKALNIGWHVEFVLRRLAGAAILKHLG